MIISRLTSKARTTIPQPIQAALHLRVGDEIAYSIEADQLVLSRAGPEAATDDPFRACSEWDDPADTEAYAGLYGAAALSKYPVRNMARHET